MISKGHSKLSIVKQCDLLKVHRSGLYYRPKPESELNLKLMREMDEHYIHHPFKGARRMHVWLTKDRGYTVSKNRRTAVLQSNGLKGNLTRAAYFKAL